MTRWIEVKVKPNAKELPVKGGDDGVCVARLKSPPVDGKANRELIALLAKEFGVRNAGVEIKTGAASRWKRVELSG
ncbi:MAG: DUF167 domain-containing protein [Verrucomicrobiales bacterium]|nr:DUF167 domain-containing protein [Verrucomicrobiales bacterium]